MTGGCSLLKLMLTPFVFFFYLKKAFLGADLDVFWASFTPRYIWCCIRRASATLAVLWSGVTVPGLCHHLLGPARSSDQVEGDLGVDDYHNGWFTKVIKPTISRVDKVNWDKTNLEPQPPLFCHPLPVNVVLASYKSKVISIFALAWCFLMLGFAN